MFVNSKDDYNLIYKKNYIFEITDKKALSNNISNVIEQTAKITKEPLSNIYFILPDNWYTSITSSQIIKQNNDKTFSFISKDLKIFKNTIIEKYKKQFPSKHCINIVINYYEVENKKITKFKSFVNIEQIKINYTLYFIDRKSYKLYSDAFSELTKYNITYINSLLATNSFIKNYLVNSLPKLFDSKQKEFNLINILDKKISCYKWIDNKAELVFYKDEGFHYFIQSIAKELRIPFDYAYEIFLISSKTYTLLENLEIFNTNLEKISSKKIINCLIKNAEKFFIKNDIYSNNNIMIYGRFAQNDLILNHLNNNQKHTKFNRETRSDLRLKYSLFFKILGANLIVKYLL